MDDIKEKHTVAALQTPAYTGALFNSLGFCINHHDVRLCTVTREGKYKILRKICPKCGSTSLRSNITRHRITQLHGSAKKELPLRKMPKNMLTAIVPPEKGGKGGSGSGSTTKAKLPDEGTGVTYNYNMKRSVPPSIKVRKSKGSTTAESTSSPRPQRGGRERSKSERQDLVPLLVELYPPPQLRSRSKSRSRNSTTKTKPMRSRSRSRTPIPISVIVSSCKSVRDKVNEVKSLVANNTTKLDELTLLTATTAPSHSTYSNSFKGQHSFNVVY